jgi:CheY-like chemotaxis protein
MTFKGKTTPWQGVAIGVEVKRQDLRLRYLRGHVALPALSITRQTGNGGQFHLLMTDHAMPHMTGAQLVRQVSGEYPQMAILIASGFAELPDDMSSVPRLKKPYSQDDLAGALKIAAAL